MGWAIGVGVGMGRGTAGRGWGVDMEGGVYEHGVWKAEVGANVG